eukprot:5650860-Pyramimonas_sp.AAC.1
MGVALVGIQESRDEQQLKGVAGKVHLRFSSGHEGHNLGTEPWVDMCVPYGKIQGRDAFFAAHHFLVLHAEPRVLIVKCSAPGVMCNICVAHAPHRRHPLAARVEFWGHLGRLAGKWLFGLTLLDANRALGPITSPFVGGAGFVEEQDESGELMHAFLHEHALQAANAFMVRGLGATFTSKGTGPCRIDYILLGSTLGQHLAYTKVLHDMDLMRDHEDHFPVLAVLERGVVSSVAKAGSSPLDRRKVADPQCIKEFQFAIDRFVLDSWETDTNDQLSRSL